MAREPQLFFADLLENDGSLMELIDSDYTFLNGRLAAHYGISGISGTKMRRADLPAGG